MDKQILIHMKHGAQTHTHTFIVVPRQGFGSLLVAIWVLAGTSTIPGLVYLNWRAKPSLYLCHGRFNFECEGLIVRIKLHP